MLPPQGKNVYLSDFSHSKFFKSFICIGKNTWIFVSYFQFMKMYFNIYLFVHVYVCLCESMSCAWKCRWRQEKGVMPLESVGRVDMSCPTGVLSRGLGSSRRAANIVEISLLAAIWTLNPVYHFLFNYFHDKEIISNIPAANRQE